MRLTPALFRKLVFLTAALVYCLTRPDRADADADKLPFPLIAPPGFKLDKKQETLGGPVSFDNFHHHYIHGGILPENGAEIIVFRTPIPRGLENFVDVELHNDEAQRVTRTPFTLSGVRCDRATYEFDDLRTYNQSTYCFTRGYLYRFHLGYNIGDAHGPDYTRAYEFVLKQAHFPDPPLPEPMPAIAKPTGSP